METLSTRRPPVRARRREAPRSECWVRGKQGLGRRGRLTVREDRAAGSRRQRRSRGARGGAGRSREPPSHACPAPGPARPHELTIWGHQASGSGREAVSQAVKGAAGAGSRVGARSARPHGPPGALLAGLAAAPAQCLGPKPAEKGGGWAVDLCPLSTLTLDALSGPGGWTSVARVLALAWTSTP